MKVCIDISRNLQRLRLKKFKNLLPAVLILATLGFMFITGFAYQNKALSLHFVDEEHNFVLGKFMLSGDKLYSDTFTNHQPLAFLASAAIQKITNPNSIFLLVKRHREVMILYSIIWSLLLVSKFRLPLLLFLIFYELTKIRLLGNLFLAESIVIYPLIYLFSLIFLRVKDWTKIELILAGFSLALITFLLSPLWPLMIVIVLIFLIRSQKRIVTLSYIFLSGLPVLVITFWFSSLYYYFRYAIFFNLKYFIPMNFPEPTILSLIKSFTAPLLSFFTSVELSPTLVFIRLFSLLLFLNLLVAFKKRDFSQIILSIFILGLANLRFIEAGQEYYRGFHLLPWFATLIFLAVVTSLKILRESHLVFAKILIIFFLSGMMILVFGQARFDVFQKRDLAQDLYINYSQQFSWGEAVKIMNAQNPQETVFVLPDEWLIYWQSGLKPPYRVNSFYGWQLPELKFQLDLMFTKNLPTYFYCRCQDLGLETIIVKYHQLIKDGKPTQLYVLPSKFQSLS